MGPYYLALKAWTVVSTSDLWVRSFSILGGMLCVLIVCEITTRRAGGRTGLVATILLLSNPMFLVQLTEARSYSWAMALTVLTVSTFEGAVEAKGWLRIFVAGFVAGITVATAFFSVFVIGGVGLVIGARHLRNRDVLSRLVIVGAMAALTLLPFLAAAVALGAHAANWISPFAVSNIRPTAFELLGGPFTAALLILGAVLSLLNGVRSTAGTAQRWAFMLAAAAAISFALLVGYSALVSSAMVARFLCAALPLCAMAAADGFTNVDRNIRWNLGIVVCMLTIASLLPDQPWRDRGRPENLRAGAQALAAEVGSDDAVLYTHPWVRIGLDRYWRPRPVSDISAERRPGDLLFPVERSLEQTTALAKHAKYLWLVGYPTGRWDRTPYPAAPLVRELLRVCPTAANLRDFGDLKVFRCDPSKLEKVKLTASIATNAGSSARQR